MSFPNSAKFPPFMFVQPHGPGTATSLARSLKKLSWTRLRMHDDIQESSISCSKIIRVCPPYLPHHRLFLLLSFLLNFLTTSAKSLLTTIIIDIKKYFLTENYPSTTPPSPSPFKTTSPIHEEPAQTKHGKSNPPPRPPRPRLPQPQRRKPPTPRPGPHPPRRNPMPHPLHHLPNILPSLRRAHNNAPRGLPFAAYALHLSP